MRLVRDPVAARWIENLKGVPEAFQWDAGNRSKGQKHGVIPADVEELFLSPVLFAGLIVEPKHSEKRWLLLGRNIAGKRLALIFTRRSNQIRPISCRAMRKNEHAVYEEDTRENAKAQND